MKNQIQPANTNRLANALLSQLMPVVSRNRVCPVALSMLVWLLFSIGHVFGGSATWNLNPSNNFWGDASNWTPATVPNGPNDTATFGVSNITNPLISDGFETELNGIVFDAGASQFTISVVSFASGAFILTISGLGITNNSGRIQNFLAQEEPEEGYNGVIQFKNSATAGDLTVFTAQAEFEFYLGEINFFDTSTAGSATLIANASFSGGGLITLADDSNGGTARVEVFGSVDGPGRGTLDISAHNAPGVTIGSIEGDGLIILGANNLTVGSSDLSTTFSGLIQDGGSFTKIGTGTLTLANANTYTGGTITEGGRLVVNNMSGSGTGSGPVQVNAGTLSGRGTIAGAVTVGTGSGAGAVLSPGRRGGKPGNSMTILSTLTFNSDATYDFGLSTKKAIADKVVANTVTVTDAHFRFRSVGQGILTPGTVFTVIDNTAAIPIAGTFSNLPDGSTFTVGNNTFQANYEGGTGNDLTLTVQ